MKKHSQLPSGPLSGPSSRKPPKQNAAPARVKQMPEASPKRWQAAEKLSQNRGQQRNGEKQQPPLQAAQPAGRHQLLNEAEEDLDAPPPPVELRPELGARGEQHGAPRPLPRLKHELPGVEIVAHQLDGHRDAVGLPLKPLPELPVPLLVSPHQEVRQLAFVQLLQHLFEACGAAELGVRHEHGAPGKLVKQLLQHFVRRFTGGLRARRRGELAGPVGYAFLSAAWRGLPGFAVGWEEGEVYGAEPRSPELGL